MSVTTTIVVLWVAFAGTHIGLSSVRLRGRLVERLGEPAYLGVFSLVAALLLVPLVWIYLANRHAGPWLWIVPRDPVVQWILYLLMGVAFVLIAASFSAPNPSMVGARGGEARGVFLLTRHPFMMGLALWAGLHLAWNASTADVAFFGGMAGFALLGTLHQDRRKLATHVPGYRAFYERTPLLPFTGRETLRGLRELPLLSVGIGVVLTIALRQLHPLLFGG